MQIRLKDETVNLDGLSIEALTALMHAAAVWKRFGMQNITITSALDGKHRPNSLHYSGNAFDLRSRTLPNELAMADQLRESLPDDYDVVLEKDHIHVEYDPKG